MALKELLKKTEYTIDRGKVDKNITRVINDSRKIEEGCLFICIKGSNFDGHDAVKEAALKSAAAVLVEREVEVPEETDITVVRVSDTRYAMAFVSAAYFGYPAEKLTTIGVTGTKGKTTTTYLIKSILEAAGRKVGLIGTIETIIGDEHFPNANTTPESFSLQKYFSQMVEAGLDTVVMEVSSQALMMHRSQGFIFDYGIFTNISPDHIGPNEHKDFEEYLHCKSLLFKQCKTGIVNGDDEHAGEVLKGADCEVIKYGLGRDNDLYAGNIELLREGALLGVAFRAKGRVEGEYKIAMPGKFSVYNALCTIALCSCFKVEDEDIRNALLKAHVKGRMERIHVSDRFSLFIDYAHNAMALESLLVSLKEYRPERIVCLFGCGGNRSRARRFEMGEVSGRLADFTIITSDNPRDEEPMDIIADIVTGIEKTKGKYIEIPDRKEAIRYAIKNGKDGDVIILAGKGHEDYQEIHGVKHPMDERVLIADILREEGMNV
ncbi:MAG: UDP-N-acetylmuramoyl-L-alanyl-D-glutamate--2,6-diaminopimelate ligase [Lachnospiraceae bacterium]|nr:UDP-N-acetylmuramoyl-L-alanyl-D-glutamate--2,6-diaminopimelate ligase [Lachnospiraceae bacterium]